MSKASDPSPDAVKAWARLMRVSRQLLEQAEAALKDQGLPPLAWYDALHEIAEAGEEGLRPYQLVERMLLAQYNVSRLLARLEAAGLIQKLDVPDDGRGQSVKITAKGREVRRRIWEIYGEFIARAVGDRLSSGNLRRLSVLLGQLGGSRTG